MRPVAVVCAGSAVLGVLPLRCHEVQLAFLMPRRQAVAALVVFIFVALWHDMNAALFTWGLAFGVLFAPEQWLHSRIQMVRSPW